MSCVNKRSGASPFDRQAQTPLVSIQPQASALAGDCLVPVLLVGSPSAAAPSTRSDQDGAVEVNRLCGRDRAQPAVRPAIGAKLAAGDFLEPVPRRQIAYPRMEDDREFSYAGLPTRPLAPLALYLFMVN